MRVDNDVVQALIDLGYQVEHVTPTDDPAFTRASKGNEFITLQKCVQLEMKTIHDIMRGLDT
jgi:hypothetical protein